MLNLQDIGNTFVVRLAGEEVSVKALGSCDFYTFVKLFTTLFKPA
jgi:hypothetical protein